MDASVTSTKFRWQGPTPIQILNRIRARNSSPSSWFNCNRNWAWQLPAPHSTFSAEPQVTLTMANAELAATPLSRQVDDHLDGWSCFAPTVDLRLKAIGDRVVAALLLIPALPLIG